ncbi:MAG: hypothetical protein LUD53_05430 [Clostridiales bacterium]|nr:hypothetical protein [Clostridiales bacterium]
MLGKLLKYEFKSTSRLLGFVYAALLVIAVVLGLLLRGDLNGIISYYNTQGMQETAIIIFILIYILIITAVIVITMFTNIERFYRNMLKGEGYLMHTLPVPTWMHVAAKTISALVYTVLSVCALIVSVFLLLIASNVPWIYIHEWLTDEFIPSLRENGISVALTAIILLVSLIRVILLFYVSMSIGAAAKKNKLAFSVLAFIAICIVMAVIRTIFLSDLIAGNASVFFVSDSGASLFYSTAEMIRQLVVDLIYSAVFFAGCTFFLGKKLNLE